MQKSRKQKLKQNLSWSIGIPATILAFCEWGDLKYWWINLAGLAVLIAVLCWNQIINFNFKSIKEFYDNFRKAL